MSTQGFRIRGIVPGRTRPVLAAVLTTVLCFLIHTGADASLRRLHVVWEDTFVDTSARGWELESYTRGDMMVVTDDPGDAVKVAGDGYFLRGESPSHDNGAGFRATSPTFDQMGVDIDEPYSIHFEYLLPWQEACWTYALASNHVSLVVATCDVAAERGWLVAVDELAGTEVPLGPITLGAWHAIDVLVEPRPLHLGDGVADLTVRVDGAVVGRVRRRENMGFDRLVFQDLPARIADATDPPALSGCFGGGCWDDVRLSVQVPAEGSEPRDLNFRMEPNPFNPVTTLRFELPEALHVRAVVYALNGRRVGTVFEGWLPVGPQVLPWDGTDSDGRAIASGTYFVRVHAGDHVVVQRASVVR
ncbi:MAG TPA: FlgD immunoglobulin-like domain containing protein [Candidatus Krumholzibacteria bacterium]|nr:FlgD immunoglobulin-like domain containing protein [Candidatus Krumholzibacteria bacterium]